MISLIRIDDRLIHGQVMAVWTRTLSVNHILVADDAVVADSFSRQIMQLAMPPAVKLTIADIRDAAALLPSIETDASRTLVLIKTVASAVQLHAGYPFRALNVGGIGMTPGRKALWRSIAASPAEMHLLEQLRQKGVDIYLQMIPSDEKRRIIGQP
ncbi:MAG: PTS sugar transporter subunit IIB [Chloroflexi bacterium]|nr:PTS sugar transporter subunit IIB [Chloroflexota bacterium]MCL5275924.1 PTS sugar transporter subunit IIB [Chloroflexota bacterium]